MAVQGLKSVSMVDDDQIAVAALDSGKDHRTICRCVDCGAHGCRDIHAPVEVQTAKNLAVSVIGRDAALDRPLEEQAVHAEEIIPLRELRIAW